MYALQLKGRKDDHKIKRDSQSDIPIVRIDYAFISGTRTAEVNVEDEITQSGAILVVHDGKYKIINAHLVPTKGPGDGWIVEQVCADIDAMGHCRIVLKCDQEPSVMRVQRLVKEARVHDTIEEHNPKGSSASNGAVENAIKQVCGQLKVLKIGLERSIVKRIRADHAIMSWLVEYSAMSLSRHHVGRDGRTAYERLKGKRCQRPVVRIGEKVLYKPYVRKGEKFEKSESKWKYGTWLGIVPKSNEYIVAGTTGAERCRTVRRLREDLKWDSDAILNMSCTPWNWRAEEKERSEAEKSSEEPVKEKGIEAREDKGALKRM